MNFIIALLIIIAFMIIRAIKGIDNAAKRAMEYKEFEERQQAAKQKTYKGVPMTKQEYDNWYRHQLIEKLKNKRLRHKI